MLVNTLSMHLPWYYCACLQVLPPDVMLLAEPSPEDLLAAVEEAIQRVPSLDPLAQHERVSPARILQTTALPASGCITLYVSIHSAARHLEGHWLLQFDSNHGR